jgi:hypothetical protein
MHTIVLTPDREEVHLVTIRTGVCDSMCAVITDIYECGERVIERSDDGVERVEVSPSLRRTRSPFELERSEVSLANVASSYNWFMDDDIGSTSDSVNKPPLLMLFLHNRVRRGRSGNLKIGLKLSLKATLGIEEPRMTDLLQRLNNDWNHSSISVGVNLAGNERLK